MRQIRVTNKLWNPLRGLLNETNEVSSGSLCRLSGTSFTNYDYDLVLRELHGLFSVSNHVHVPWSLGRVLLTIS